ncbi:hypothetical protein [Aureibacter tunicatorum]|uniref:tRNA threonylcarbamoyladenosine modification (KEOPS) complex Cgi121 subunit n=1 Tax=Aureibacter tunicatorum TaxID=866807 RepID=A0AAE3XN08_9BACT|nr:hypothetical protein [Aureibacter tunicatorum]MDR6239957.1 tRNA threonylcarbamoyladenosine modification (KEOPS) complex Cgi121 subunit [Aureibacter tunicatorum]BDD04430.1 hypothetical protein AUTU_19130 [Aureibacter tunicatorum]
MNNWIEITHKTASTKNIIQAIDITGAGNFECVLGKIVRSNTGEIHIMNINTHVMHKNMSHYREIPANEMLAITNQGIPSLIHHKGHFQCKILEKGSYQPRWMPNSDLRFQPKILN